MNNLTARQREVLRWVKQFATLNGYAPTRAELAQAFGFRSLNAAEQHLRAIARSGAITLVPRISRGIVLPPSSQTTAPK